MIACAQMPESPAEGGSSLGPRIAQDFPPETFRFFFSPTRLVFTMSRDDARHRLRERGRPSVPPRPTTLSATIARVRRRRHSDTMDGNVQMIDLPSQGAPAEISSDYRGQESRLTEFQAKVVQDMADIQHGLNCLAQHVAAVPGQVLEGMARVEAPEGSSWRNWFTVCTQRPFAPRPILPVLTSATLR